MYIDIRDTRSYKMGHIEGAINIPALKLYKSPSLYLKKDETYYIYCQSGSNSRLLVNYLNSMGYVCINLEGGYSKYLLK